MENDAIKIGDIKEVIFLYERLEKTDKLGGVIEEWKKIGEAWAAISPCSISYPLRKDGKNRYSGSAFDLTFRIEDNANLADKFVHNGVELFPIVSTPKLYKKGYITIRAFSWEAAK
ncbi:head-tail adaptor protein [Candidatus Hydrogenosomobacter endosymbioticus]|uniref:Uncharacterized protein n=1 Tax=Candidatus Hydrogenosomobacter endosymbioticus TaxID=2558174 RepID=A0ABN6L246_9PROT|nr:hypothetical protein [Candidatus Hydrogenosomobacter endosymbioticus]BDB95914.1 hypothetical protein HYD_0470 [Candidatus Hydrogenosomobacter endosymbioticus]